MLVPALGRGEMVEGHRLWPVLHVLAVQGVVGALVRVEHGELSRREEGDGVGEGQQGGQVAGQVHLSLAVPDADSSRVTDAEGHHGVRVAGVEGGDGVSASELDGGLADRIRKGRALGQTLLDEMSDYLRVGGGVEGVPRAQKPFLELQVVLHDSVVDHDHPVGAVGMGVGVGFGGSAVGGPPGVAEAPGARKRVGFHLFDKVLELAGGLADCEALRPVDDREASAVIPTVLKPGQALEDQRGCFPGAQIAEDAAHRPSTRCRIVP